MRPCTRCPAAFFSSTPQFRHRTRVLASCAASTALRAPPTTSMDPQPQIAVFVADVRDASSVGRPARVRRVELAERQRQLRIAGERRQPQLMPLTSLVAAVQHAPAVRRDFRSRAPAGFFVHEAFELARAVDRGAAQVAGAVRDLAIGNEHEPLAVRRPRRIDRVIVLRIVVARDLALARRDDGARRAELAGFDRCDEQIEVTAAGRRHVSEPLAVGRVARLEVDGVGRRELLRRARRHVELPQLDRVVVVTREDDVPSVRRPVRLIVVARSVRQLDRAVAADLLPPQRAGHAVDERLCRRARTRGSTGRSSAAAGTSRGSNSCAADRSASAPARAAAKAAAATASASAAPAAAVRIARLTRSAFRRDWRRG